MNLKRFTGRTSREALALVRQAFGKAAIVMSTRPCPEGVEVLAMAPESLQHLEKLGASAPLAETRQRVHDPVAADGTAQKRIARDIQAEAFKVVPYIPLGQMFAPMAYKKELTGILDGYALFWNVKRG